MTLKSTLETGWTSNATETVEGEADRFTQQNHELLLSGTLGTMSLRGTLVFEQTSFAQTVTENDTSIAGGVEVGLALGEDVVLRAGYAVTRDWTGEGLFVAGRQIGVASETLTHEALLELTIAGVDQQAIVSVNGSWRYPGDATISGLPIVIPPLQLDPQVARVGVAVDWEKAMTERAALLGRLASDFSSVPVEDQFDFGRIPGTAATVAGGARIKTGGLGLEALAGATMVWPVIDPGLRETMPYLSAKAELAVGPQWTFAARIEKRVELDDPLDPVASSVNEVELSARYQIAESISVSAALGRSDEEGIFDKNQAAITQTASVRLDYAVSKTIGASIAASRKWVDQVGDVYHVDRVSVALNALF